MFKQARRRFKIFKTSKDLLSHFLIFWLNIFILCKHFVPAFKVTTNDKSFVFVWVTHFLLFWMNIFILCTHFVPAFKVITKDKPFVFNQVNEVGELFQELYISVGKGMELTAEPWEIYNQGMIVWISRCAQW